MPFVQTVRRFGASSICYNCSSDPLQSKAISDGRSSHCAELGFLRRIICLVQPMPTLFTFCLSAGGAPEYRYALWVVCPVLYASCPRRYESMHCGKSRHDLTDPDESGCRVATISPDRKQRLQKIGVKSVSEKGNRHTVRVIQFFP